MSAPSSNGESLDRVSQDSRRKLLRSATTFVGNIGFAGAQWVAVALIARLSTMTAVGEYTLAMAVATPIYTFFGFNFRGVLASSRLVGASLPVLFRFKSLTAAIAAAITLAVLLTSYRSQVGWSLALGVCLIKSADAMFDLPYGEWLRRGWLYQYSLSQIFRGVVLCLVTVIILGRGEPIGVALIWVGLGWILAPGLLEYAQLWRLPPHDPTGTPPNPAAGSARAIVASTWTLGVAVCLLQVHNNLPRYVLARAVDYETVGRYSCYYYLIFAGHLAITAIGQTLAGSLGRAWLNSELQDFRGVAKKLMQSAFIVHAGAILAVLVAGQWILPILYGSRANLSVA